MSKTTNEVKTEVAKSGDSQQKKSFNKKQQQTTSRSTTKFEGRCDDLKGHVYDYGEHKNADQFNTTTKEIIGYVGRTYKCGGDISAAITALEVPDIEEPDEPDNENSRIQMKRWEREYDEYREKKTTLDDNIKALYHLVWGQCSDSMQQKIESLDGFEDLRADSNGIDLLVAIKDAAYDYQSQKYRLQSILEAKYRLMTFRQNQMTIQ
jgi:hypothetical protein